MEVTIDDKSGFCFGVVYAIQMAEDILTEDQEGDVKYAAGVAGYI